MTQAFVYDRCIDAARETAAELLKGRVPGFALRPDGFDPTFQPGGAPHLIVTELDMSPIDGVALVGMVRSYWSAVELPVIVYTSVSDPTILEQALAAGANAVVSRAGAGAAGHLAAAVERCLRRTIPALEPMRPAGGIWRMLDPFRSGRAAA